MRDAPVWSRRLPFGTSSRRIPEISCRAVLIVPTKIRRGPVVQETRTFGPLGRPVDRLLKNLRNNEPGETHSTHTMSEPARPASQTNFLNVAPRTLSHCNKWKSRDSPCDGGSQFHTVYKVLNLRTLAFVYPRKFTCLSVLPNNDRKFVTVDPREERNRDGRRG